MKLFVWTLMFSTSLSFAAVNDKTSIQLLKKTSTNKTRLEKSDVVAIERLESMFRMDARTPGLAAMLKRNTFKHKEKAVPTLIKVMKESKYPDQNRWQATMLLAQIMGAKSAPFIAKFSDHPHWMMRLASLKALLGLKQDNYTSIFSKGLKDPSLIVRIQALDNISKMQIKKLAPEVWAMMYDQSNYSGEAGKRTRTSIVKSIIRTIGDLKYEKAGKSLAKLIQKPKYQDLIDDLDYSLEKITGEKSPNNIEQRRKHWSKLVLNSANNKKI